MWFSRRQMAVLERFRRTLELRCGSYGPHVRQFVSENPETVRRAEAGLDRIMCGEATGGGSQVIGQIIRGQAIGAIRYLSEIY